MSRVLWILLLVFWLTLYAAPAGEAQSPPTPRFNRPLAGALDSSSNAPSSGTPSNGDNGVPRKKAPSDDLDSPAAYDEAISELMRQLLESAPAAPDESDAADPAKKPDSKSGKVKIKTEHHETREEREQREAVTAQDAARKLASLGKRAVPALTKLMRASVDKPDSVKGASKAAYYSVWALSRIRTSDAAAALLPLLTNTSARTELRHMAVEANGWEKNEEGVRALQKVATSDPDSEMRKKALSQLTMIPEFWQASEPIFVTALDDPDGEARTLAAKACHFSHIFLSANDKLVELLENDPLPAVRTFAMLTLGRLKYKPAQPALMRVLRNPATDEKLRKVALNALGLISEFPFSKVENAEAWWKREGEVKFAEAAKREEALREQLTQLDESAKREKRQAALNMHADAAAVPAPDSSPKPPLMLARPAAVVAPDKLADLLVDEPPPVRRAPPPLPEEDRARNVDPPKAAVVRRSADSVPDAGTVNDPATASSPRRRKGE